MLFSYFRSLDNEEVKACRTMKQFGVENWFIAYFNLLEFNRLIVSINFSTESSSEKNIEEEIK